MLSYALTTREGYGGVVAWGSTVSQAELSQFGPPNPSSVSCVKKRCFALATVGGFQYPLVSSDGGRTWRNAGHWFAGPWADGAAFADAIVAFSATVAVAWYPGQSTFYVTSDAGRRWYSAWPDGEVTAVTSSNLGATLVMHVRAYAPARERYEYRCSDGGRRWIRTA